MRESRPCQQLTPNSTSCTIRDFKMFYPVPHVLNVTAILPEGIITTLLPFVPEQIMKPDRPVYVRVNPAPENRLLVQWYEPVSWPNFAGLTLIYQIRYKDCEAEHFQEVGPTENTNYMINSVPPNATYCVQVKGRDVYSYGLWSDWSYLAKSPLILAN
ncbi:PREDICTED: interleukin-27 subunit beta-like [Elephantulus edwardii]|uniref:interleukin-27 subunit beta-like n=1 Tax=Elephantulus edwardii TaxID=28737 RepID=UPI0003F0B495|nr:PREDICTED: interleukin-27 subunit beta-like [Elephantulus edwardii]